MSAWLLPLIIIAIKSIVLMVVLLLFVAYYLYADRKIWAAVQLRRGPNVVGPWGLWQSFADLMKFALKEPIIPDGANKLVFLLAPCITAILALSAWAVIPVAEGVWVANINVGILYIFAISSLSVYGIIMGGWASNSKYPFLAALRSAAQMVSYEVSIGFVIITVLLCAGSLNLADIVRAQDTSFGFLGWYWLPLFPMLIVFFVSAMAETNRPPFDLVEAEVRARRRLHGRVFGDALHAVHAGRVRRHRHDVRDDGNPVLRRLALAHSLPALHLDSGNHMVRPEGDVLLFHDRHGEGAGAALPL